MITKKMRLLALSVVILSLLVSSLSVFAMAVDTAATSDNVSVVNSLTLNVSEGVATWTVDGISSKGYKVVWSKNSAPTYPTRSGDKYHYISDPAITTSSLEAFDGAGEYHVRVCEYLGGKCGKYSNEVVVQLGESMEEDDLDDIIDDEGFEGDHEGGEGEIDHDNVNSLTLSVNGDRATWTVDGISSNGYKLVWSKNAKPTYPTRDGDKYNYIADPAMMMSSLDAFDGAGEYYVRVCEYLGGKCGKYSNEILVQLGDDTDDLVDDVDNVIENAIKQKKELKHSIVSEFKDVKEQNKNFKAISYLREKGVVRGDGKTGEFKPESTINRAGFLKIVLVAKGVELESGSSCFSDVKADDWFAPYICTAKTMGLIKGYSDGTYRPSRDIKLSESSKIIVKTFGLPEADKDEKVWYKQYVGALDKYAAIPSTIDSFSHKMTRGEMAEMIWRIDAGEKTHESTNYTKLMEKKRGELHDYDVVLGDDAVRSLTLNVNKNKATWTVDGHSKKGYKVVWSKNSAPTYPTREGDKYNYISDASVMSSSLDAFDGGGEYYVRVCEYLGGKCGKYSNEKKVWLDE